LGTEQGKHIVRVKPLTAAEQRLVYDAIAAGKVHKLAAGEVRILIRPATCSN
jgi:hypothetical protein